MPNQKKPERAPDPRPHVKIQYGVTKENAFERIAQVLAKVSR